MPRLVEYADAPPEVRAVFDDIKAVRGVPDVNNFWKALAVHPPTLQRTWESLKEVMAPGGGGPAPAPLLHRGRADAVAAGQRPHALFTPLYRATDCLRR